MKTPFSATYSQLILPAQPAPGDLAALVEPYQAMILAQFQAILARTERSATYPWLDTKIDLLAGKDYPAGHPLFGRELVSGWVQGRGLEALVGFARWLAPYAGDPDVDQAVARARRLAADLLARLRSARTVNGGHTYFYMTPAGAAFLFAADGTRQLLGLTEAAPYNYSDLFVAKGMYAAAQWLDDRQALAEARAYCRAVYGSILAGTFTSDQPAPPTVARAWVPGAASHGPYMIAQGMAALLAAYEPGPDTTAMAVTLARHVWDTHVNVHGKWPQLAELDLVEYVDAEGRPYLDDGHVVSDPGHALEYAGLLLKLHAALAGQDHGALADIVKAMPAYLARNFANGFRPAAGGICKTVDLLTRQPLDDTLPWWSLPETIRAGLGCRQVAATEAQRRACLAIVSQCHNAFVEHYVRPEVYLMAVKVRDAAGRPLDLVPAYPDADPGYHTALSLIDALGVIDRIQASI